MFTGVECENDSSLPVPVLLIDRSGQIVSNSCNYQTDSNNIDSYCIETEAGYSINASQLESNVESYQLDSGASNVSVAGNAYYIENAIGSCDDDSGQVSGYQFVSDEAYTSAIEGSTELYQIVEPGQGQVYRLDPSNGSDLNVRPSVGDLCSNDAQRVVIQCVEYVGNDEDGNISSAIIGDHSQDQPFIPEDLDMTVEDHSSAGVDGLASTASNPVIVGISRAATTVPGAKQMSGNKPYVVVPSSMLSGTVLETLQNQQLVVAAANNGQLGDGQQVIYQLANPSSFILQAPVQLKHVSTSSGQFRFSVCSLNDINFK